MAARQCAGYLTMIAYAAAATTSRANQPSEWLTTKMGSYLRYNVFVTVCGSDAASQV